VKKSTWAPTNSAETLLGQGSESRIDFARGAGLCDDQFSSERSGCRLRVFRVGLGIGIVRVDQHAEGSAPGRPLAQQLQPLRHQLVDQEAHAGEVAAGPVEAGDEAQLDRVAAGHEDNRKRRRRRLGGECRGGRVRDEHADLTANQIGRQGRQSIKLPLRGTVLDCHVLAFDEAILLQALAKRSQPSGLSLEHRAVEESDHRQGCCARAAIGQTAAAADSDMKSRRFV
jgi:hypothetical protein